MVYSTLIGCEVLEQNLANENWILVDCRFNLQDTDSGFLAYEQAHIPGAVYVHLDDDLCGPPITDYGRHPLPSPTAMSALFGKLGIKKESQVIVYDDSNGAFASRLWWMLRFMGHFAVAVLDGGYNAWHRARLPEREGVESNLPVRYASMPRAAWLVRLDEVSDLPFLVDSRSPERHRGEIEPIDPRAGHIPGSINYFYQQNWGDDGLYLSREMLRERFEHLLGERPIEDVTFYCGSGVTACVNLLALDHAGLGNARLYVGSWGEWCKDPNRPVATDG